MERPGQDIADLGSGSSSPAHTPGSSGAGADRGPQGRRWLSVWFNCCHAYGRIYRNAAGTEYAGRCPRCGVRVCAKIGPGGVDRRLFETT